MHVGSQWKSLHELDAVPDVVGSPAGRVLALVKNQVEQAQRFDEALLGDLAVERQMQDRARYLQTLTVRSVTPAQAGAFAEVYRSPRR